MGQYTQSIQQLYVSYFSRPADAAGLQYWEDFAAQHKGDLSQISNAFANSAENLARLADKGSLEIVDQMYVSLFGRHAEAGGLKYWADLLDQKAISQEHIVEVLGAGAQGSDATALHSKVMAAIAFTSALDTPIETQSYSGAQAIANAQLFLSSIVDTGTFLSALSASGTMNKVIDHLLDPQMGSSLGIKGIAVGEPMPGTGGKGVAVGEPHPGTIAVGEPNPGAATIAVGEPHPGQGIAIGEPNPAAQGFAVGEPHPGAQGFAIGEPSPVDMVKLIGLETTTLSGF